MTALLFYSLLHILVWGTIGAVIAARAGVSRWIGILVSVVFPVLGSMTLLFVWFKKGQPRARTAPATWRKLGWVGVGGGLLVVLAAWLPWVSADVHGAAQELEVADFGFQSSSLGGLALLGSVMGISIAACFYGAIRTGRGAWLIATALLAWLPAAVAGGLVLSEGFIDDLGDKADDVANAATVVSSVSAEVSAEYSIGSGPYLCLLSSLFVLLWAFFLAVRVPLAADAANDSGSGDPTPKLMSPGSDWDDGWEEGSSGQRSIDAGSDWDW